MHHHNTSSGNLNLRFTISLLVGCRLARNLLHLESTPPYAQS